MAFMGRSDQESETSPDPGRVFGSYEGRSGSPVASSIDPPTSPTSAASRMVSATAPGLSPHPFSRSAEMGPSVAAPMPRGARAPPRG